MLTKDEVTLEEVLRLVDFERNERGKVRVLHVKGDVWGNVKGGVLGNVWGDVLGNVLGGTSTKDN